MSTVDIGLGGGSQLARDAEAKRYGLQRHLMLRMVEPSGCRPGLMVAGLAALRFWKVAARSSPVKVISSSHSR